MTNGLLILLLAFCASFVQRTIGFGFGIFVMTMLPLLMPSFGEATTLSGLLAMLTSTAVTLSCPSWPYSSSFPPGPSSSFPASRTAPSRSSWGLS